MGTFKILIRKSQVWDFETHLGTIHSLPTLFVLKVKELKSFYYVDVHCQYGTSYDFIIADFDMPEGYIPAKIALGMRYVGWQNLKHNNTEFFFRINQTIPVCSTISIPTNTRLTDDASMYSSTGPEPYVFLMFSLLSFIKYFWVKIQYVGKNGGSGQNSGK